MYKHTSKRSKTSFRLIIICHLFTYIYQADTRYLLDFMKEHKEESDINLISFPSIKIIEKLKNIILNR